MALVILFLVLCLCLCVALAIKNSKILYHQWNARKRQVELIELIPGPPCLPLLGLAHQFRWRVEGLHIIQTLWNLLTELRICTTIAAICAR